MSGSGAWIIRVTVEPHWLGERGWRVVQHFHAFYLPVQIHHVRSPSFGESPNSKKKLDNMLYVGLTENHKESANMFANVAAQVISKHKTSSSNSDGAGNDNSEQGSLLPNMKSDAIDKNVSSTGEDKAVQENVTL